MTTLVPKYDQGAAGAVNRPFIAKLQESISVLDFGAIGNGITDDTVAIQAAIDSLSGIGIVKFPKGTYKVSATINLVDKPNVSLIGEGFTASKLVATASFTGTILLDMQNVSSTYGASSVISGLYLSGSAGCTTGIKQNYSTLSTLSDLYVQDFSTHGIYSDNGYVDYWQSIKLQGCGVGFYLNGANHASSYNNIHISNSTVGACAISGVTKADGNSALVFNSLQIDSANATSSSLVKIDTGSEQFIVKFNDCYIGEYADGGQSIIEVITGTAIFENGVVFAQAGNLATLTGGLLELKDLDLRLKAIENLYTGTVGQIKLTNVYTTMASSSAAAALTGDTLQARNIVRNLISAPFGKNWTTSVFTGAFTLTSGNVGITAECTTGGFLFLSTPLSNSYRLGSNAQITIVYSSNIPLELVVSSGAGGVNPKKQIGQSDLPSTAGVVKTFIDTGLLSGTLDQLYTTLEFRGNGGGAYSIGNLFTIYEVYITDVPTAPRWLTLAKS
jgi:hypothetical protein